MKNIFQLIILSLVCISVNAQKIHVDYKVVSKTKNSVTIDVFVNKTTSEELRISALNNIFTYQNGFKPSEVEWSASPAFAHILGNRGVLLEDMSKLGAVQIPNNAGNGLAAKLSDKPMKYGTLVIKSKSAINYPLRLKPATLGNPTVQSVVYHNGAENSTALTLKDGTITTSFSELVITGPSQVVRVDKVITGGEIIQTRVYPVPAKSNFYTDIILAESKDITMTIADISGKIIFSKVTTLSDGEHQLNTDISSYPAGTYTVTLDGGNEIINTHKLIKID